MVQFASYLRRVLCETRLIFPCINGPNVFARQVVVTLALSDTRLAICVSLPSFAFVSCDFFPFRIKGKIICELVSWKSWYSRHWVKPLGLPSLIVLRLFCSFRHLKFSWRPTFKEVRAGEEFIRTLQRFNLSEILLCMCQHVSGFEIYMNMD